MMGGITLGNQGGSFMLSPQQQAVDRIFTEGWNLALGVVAQHVEAMGGTITQEDMAYIVREESIPEVP
jgi:hypothetical protein